jgi:hypothetical protein
MDIPYANANRRESDRNHFFLVLIQNSEVNASARESLRLAQREFSIAKSSITSPSLNGQPISPEKKRLRSRIVVQSPKMMVIIVLSPTGFDVIETGRKDSKP